MINRSVTWADWDEELLALERADLRVSDFDLNLTGFDSQEIDALLTIEEDLEADVAPPVPDDSVTRLGDLWLCGKHRVLCGDCASLPPDCSWISSRHHHFVGDAECLAHRARVCHTLASYIESGAVGRSCDDCG